MADIALDPEEREALAKILREEMEAARLRSQVEEWFGVKFDVIAPGASAEAAPSELLSWVTRNGRTKDLLAGLLRDCPKGPGLVGFLSSLGAPPANPLQGLLSFQGPMAPWNVFAANQLRRGGQICRVEIDASPKGTGVLVAPDRVLTSHHVVQACLDAEGRPVNGAGMRIRCRFDHAALANGIDLQQGFAVELADAWLVSSCPPHPHEGRLELTEPPDCRTRLDYAVLRLASPVGATALSPGGGAPRGWVEFPVAERLELENAQPILIGQHPGGSALHLAVGTFVSMDVNEARIRYNVNTMQGSSGAPCFDLRFDLVGLHNAEIPGHPLNQGIPIWRIRDHVNAHSGALSAARQRDFVPIWRLPDRRPVLGRADLQRFLWRITTRDSDQRIVVVKGGPGSGRTFTISIVKALFSRRPEVIVDYDMAGLQDKGPDALLRDLARDLKLEMGAAPARPTDRQSARWASTILFDWFSSAFASRFPAEASDAPSVWIVLDNFDRYVLQDEETRDVLIRLMRGAPHLGALRWIVIGAAPDPTTVRSSLVQEEIIAPPNASEVAEFLKRHAEQERKALPPATIDAMAPGLLMLARGNATPDKVLLANLASGLAQLAESMT